MKFLFHFYDLHQRAGIQRAICELSNALVAEGHEVVVLSETDRAGTAYKFDARVQIDTYCNPEPQKTGLPAWPAKVFWACRQYSALRKAIVRHRPTLVVDHGTALGIVYPLSRIAGTPFALQRHFPARSFPSGIILYRILSKIAGSKTIVVLTDGIASEMRRFGFRNIRVIPNPVPANALPADYPLSKPRIGLLMGRAGNPQKGFDLFLEALSLHAIGDWVFKIIGPGVEADPLLTRLVKKHNLEGKVELLPPTTDPYREIRQCSCLIAPSRYEGLPMVVLEALSIGRPVLGADVDGIRELVIPGVNGILFQSEDIHSLSRVLMDIGSSPDKLVRMASLAPSTVARYQGTAIVQLWLSYIRDKHS